MKNVMLFTALLASSAALAQSGSTAADTPLARYLPAGALGVFEARDLGSAYDTLAPLIRGAVQSVAPDFPITELNTGIGLLSGSFGRESSIGVYTVGRAGGVLQPQYLAVTRTNALTNASLFGTWRSSGITGRVGAFTFRQTSTSEYAGEGYGIAYASSDAQLLRAFLERVQGGSGPTLAQNPKYQEAMRGLEGRQLGVYLNLEGAATWIRSGLREVFVPRILDPLVETLNTLGQTGLGLRVVRQGIEAKSVQVLNRAGKDRDLLALASAQKAQFSSLERIPSTVAGVQTCALDPVAGPRNWAKWITRFDLFDPTGLIVDSDLTNTLLDSSAWLGDEESTVTLELLPSNPNSVLSSFENTVYMVAVRDEAAAGAAMERFVPAFNASLGGSLGFYRQGLGSLGALFGVGSLGTDFDELLSGDLNLEYRVQDGYLYLASQEGVLEGFLEAPEKLSSLPEVRALAQGGRCLSYAAGTTDFQRTDVERLVRQSLGSNAAIFPNEVFQQTVTVLEQVLGVVGVSTSSTQVVGNRLEGRGMLNIAWE